MRRLLFLLLISFTLSACAAPETVPPGPPTGPASLSDTVFMTSDGAALPMRLWMPKNGKPKAVILALHGFNDYSNFFDAPGKFLADRGIASYAYDQRGFGSSPNRGLWPGIEAFSNDLKAATRLIRARHPATPVYLLGASMGGAVILVSMTGPNPPVADGVILSAPAVWGRETMPWYQTTALWIAAHTMPSVTVTGRGLKIKPSNNIEMLRALGRDPLVIKKTRIDTIYGLVNLMDAALNAAGKFTSPALILYGGKDEVIPKRSTGLMVERLANRRVNQQRFAFYKDSYHMLLRDLQAKTVWKDLAAWIENGDAPLPSAADYGFRHNQSASGSNFPFNPEALSRKIDLPERGLARVGRAGHPMGRGF